MSVNVTIKEKGLRKKKLEIKDVILEGMRYGIMDESYRLEEGKVLENTVIFNDKEIARGYEISLEKGEIHLNMPLPTSEKDIRFFYEYVKILCEKLKTKIFIREEEKCTFDQIPSFIDMDMKTSESALKLMEENMDKGEYENMYLFGALNPIAIGKKEIEIIDGNVSKLGELLDHLQRKDLYYAAPQIYQRKDGTYFGVYILTEDIPSIFPYQPKLLVTDKKIEVSEWNIGFVVDKEVKGFTSYHDFLSSVKKEEEYDSEHFTIKMKKKEIKELLEKYKIDL